MLKRIGAYIQDNIPLARIFFKNHHNGFVKGLTAITIAPKEIAVLSASPQSGRMQINCCKQYPYDHPENLKAILATLVRENHLQMKACIWILQPDDYQLLLTDALPVTESEFAAAVRWKIKDLITLPLDDIVIDHFKVPSSSADSNKKIMVVVAKTSYLQSISEKIEASDLHLEIIDIPELCFRNINALYEADQKAMALIYVQEKNIQLIITCNEKLYFSRRLTAKLTPDKKLDLERMAVEIQRSFDYFANQWRVKAPERALFVATVPIDPEELKELGQKINAEVDYIDIMAKINSTLRLNLSDQGKYLSLIGCLLKVIPKVDQSTGVAKPKQLAEEGA